ncbi:MAG: UMP kinase [candidate division WOR-3 bacterium]
MNEIIVFSLGGSVINPGVIDSLFLQQFADLIREEVQAGKRFVIVTGGGKVARDYIHALPKNATEASKDVVGILSTWLNAQLLSYYLAGLCPTINYPKTFNEIVNELTLYPVVCSGGLVPGIKTDEDAAIFTDYFHASWLINVTNVDGVYDKDPNIYPDARKYAKLTYGEFYKLLGDTSFNAGIHAPFTLMAAHIAERDRAKIVVVSKDLVSIKRAIKGEAVGTVIVPE